MASRSPEPSTSTSPRLSQSVTLPLRGSESSALAPAIDISSSFLSSSPSFSPSRFRTRAVFLALLDQLNADGSTGCSSPFSPSVACSSCSSVKTLASPQGGCEMYKCREIPGFKRHRRSPVFVRTRSHPRQSQNSKNVAADVVVGVVAADDVVFVCISC